MGPSLLHCRQILYHLSHQGLLKAPLKLWGCLVLGPWLQPQRFSWSFLLLSVACEIRFSAICWAVLVWMDIVAPSSNSWFFFFFFTARDHFCWSWGAGLIASLGTHSLYFIHSAACWTDRALSSLRKLTGSFSVSAPLSGLGYVPYKSKHQLLWPAPSSRSF